MTDDHFTQKITEMSALQDAALTLIAPHAGQVLATSKLCGGTALSRFYLRHRISYDLDFFVPEGSGFDAQILADQIARSVPLHRVEISHDKVKADQLHFFVDAGSQAMVKISFVEDMYSKLYPPVSAPELVGGLQLKTESIEGLFHRKMRTVVGWAPEMATSPAGGRQTARDMFDLYVLSKKSAPIAAFADSLSYSFPMEAFIEGIANMPWYELIAELVETVSAPEWDAAKDVDELRLHIFREIGMTDENQDTFQGERS
jgi:hypothetical protein